MHKRNDITAPGWSNYELIDSGNHMKLERFGDVVLARPETQALWEKKFPQKWDDAHQHLSFQKGKASGL
jgi:23S rRNA (cytosine1962-C5)-methyltransferase